METIKLKYLVPFKAIRYVILGLLFAMMTQSSKAQSSEAKQLLLNVEKLSQLKNILADMKKGYTIITNGYNAVRDISKGNFKIHEVFLDGLMVVNPEIKKYKRVADIISYQKNIISEYQQALSRFSSSKNFSADEINYFTKVYQQLFNQSLDNLDELLMVITSSKLRMADNERLMAIDRIFLDTQDKLIFLRSFNKEASILNLQRQKEKSDVQATKKYFNLN